MSGTTANGWPYVTPDDHPKEFPAASQALAQKLDTLGASAQTKRTTQDDAPADTWGAVAAVTVPATAGSVWLIHVGIPMANLAATASQLSARLSIGGAEVFATLSGAPASSQTNVAFVYEHTAAGAFTAAAEAKNTAGNLRLYPGGYIHAHRIR